MQPAEDVDPDMHHRAFFSFEPSLFLADLGNIVSTTLLLNAQRTLHTHAALTTQQHPLCLQALDYSISGIHQLER